MTEFKIKSADELEKMSADQLHSYYVEKLNSEKEALETRVKALETEKEDTEAYEKLSAEVKSLKEQSYETLKLAVKEQGIVLDGLRKNAVDASTIHGAEGTVEKALTEYAEDFKSSKEGKHAFKFDLSLKAAGDMTLSGNVSGGTMPQAQRLEGVNDIAERSVVTYPLIPKLNTSANTIEWVYESGQDGTIDGTAEGAAKDQIDNDFVVTSVALVKRAAYFKVSTEMLDDVSFMAGWLRNKLIVRLFLDIDNQCLNGNNAAPNLNGIIAQSTAFAPGSFATASANEVTNANTADVLVVAMNQIKLANQGNNSLTIMLNPTDVAALKTKKVGTADDRYVDRLLMIGSTFTLDGVPIVENNDIPEGDYLVGAFGLATIVQKSSISVEVGLDGNDFTKNMRTILAEWRGQCFIQNNDTTAFVTGDLATDIAAITA